MPAITLWQPWATLVALGHKTIETRTHRRFDSLAGRRIAIHAAKRFDEVGVLELHAFMTDRQLFEAFAVARQQSGVVVCTAYVAQARPLGPTDSNSALIDCANHRLHGLVLTCINRIDPPEPARGHQGIWQWLPPLVDTAGGLRPKGL